MDLIVAKGPLQPSNNITILEEKEESMSSKAQPNTAKFPPMKDAKDQFLVDNFKE